MIMMTKMVMMPMMDHDEKDDDADKDVMTMIVMMTKMVMMTMMHSDDNYGNDDEDVTSKTSSVFD